MIPLRVLPIREGRGVCQTWLLGAEKPPPAMELTLPSGKVFVRAEMSGPRKARTDVWDKIKQQRDQPQGGAADFDPWLNRTAQGTAPAVQKNPWQGWKGTMTNEKREEMQVRQDPPVNIMEMVTKKCEEMKREMLVGVETLRDQARGELEGAAIQMRTLQEAMANQQAKMSKVEEVITTTAARERMMRMMKEKEKRKKPDSDVELEDDSL